MNYKILIFSFLVVSASCKQTSIVSEKETFSKVFTEVYAPDSLNTQTFKINQGINNIITCRSGTVIRIGKNTFVGTDGSAVTDSIDVKVIEALDPVDWALNNLTTTYNNEPLESGGMIYLDAVSGNVSLKIDSAKSIQVKMPVDSVVSNMSLFEGKWDSSGITWSNPVELPSNDSLDKSIISVFEKTTNVYYTVEGFSEVSSFPAEVNMEVSRIAWAGDGLKIAKDSILKIGKYTVHFIKNNQLQTWTQVFSNERGKNSYSEDIRTNYIFSVKKLGWANIDRLLQDPRTKEVELITSVENAREFEFIYVTMITKRMYLPGYQKEDGTFSFSHSDAEKQQFPVGETATILATAYKNDKPYYAIKRINISEKQNVSFRLEETTVIKLKNELKAKI